MAISRLRGLLCAGKFMALTLRDFPIPAFCWDKGLEKCFGKVGVCGELKAKRYQSLPIAMVLESWRRVRSASYFFQRTWVQALAHKHG